MSENKKRLRGSLERFYEYNISAGSKKISEINDFPELYKKYGSGQLKGSKVLVVELIEEVPLLKSFLIKHSIGREIKAEKLLEIVTGNNSTQNTFNFEDYSCLYIS
jgi:hypothetical protein